MSEPLFLPGEVLKLRSSGGPVFMAVRDRRWDGRKYDYLIGGKDDTPYNGAWFTEAFLKEIAYGGK